MQKIRILIADHAAGFRCHVRECLAAEPSIQVVGEAGDALEMLAEAVALEPDLVLMGVGNPDEIGLDSIRQITARLPQVRIIVLGGFDLREYRDAAQTSGASDYVVKRHLYQELLPAIRDVAHDAAVAAADRQIAACVSADHERLTGVS